MQFVASFDRLLQPLAAEFTSPSFQNLRVILLGWVFAGRRTVTGMIVAALATRRCHHSVFHRLFSTAAWSLDRVGLRLFDLIRSRLGDGTISLAIDDTLAHKSGKKVFGVGMNHDPQLSSKSHTVTSWSHSWVVCGVVIRLPFAEDRVFCLPILFRLYMNKAASERAGREHRTRPQLCVQMLEILASHCPRRRFHAVVDTAYGGKSVVGKLPKNIDVTSRIGLNARLYEKVQPRRRGQRGRTRKYGQRLPNPSDVFDASEKQEIELDIYGRREKARMVSFVAYLHADPTRPVKVVVIEALEGGRGREVFFSTVADADPIAILRGYADRWAIEVTFRDAKQSLGFEQPQGWSEGAVERTAPMGMLLYSLIVLWFDEVGHRKCKPLHRPWYRQREHASFADMLGTLRRQSVKESVLRTPLQGPGSRKILRILNTSFQAAA